MSDRLMKLLFVCTGNICRSPTAEGVLRDLVDKEGLSDRVLTDSAGTHGYHVGERPDSRSVQAARVRGIDISDLRARKVERHDFDEFDYILAMDGMNMRCLQPMMRADCRAQLTYMLAHGSQSGHQEVPDPYYGGSDGFELVLDLLEDASAGLLEKVKARL